MVLLFFVLPLEIIDHYLVSQYLRRQEQYLEKEFDGFHGVEFGYVLKFEKWVLSWRFLTHLIRPASRCKTL